MKLENKVAIVTGAAAGIGLAIAQRFLAEGAKVVFSDVVGDESLVSAYADKAMFVKCDVSSSSQVDALVGKAMERFGRLDIMVNNAGIATDGTAVTTTDGTWHKTIETNLSGVFYGLRAAAKAMLVQKSGGAIVNISSIAGTVGFEDSLAYCSSKGGITQMTRAAALDLAKEKIRVNAIAPGVIETNMTKDYLADAGFQKMVKMMTPLGSVGKPDDIADAALYLVSGDSSYMTGQILHVDGGWTAK